MNMNVPHLHLLLNHIPTIGGAAALTLLVVAFARKSDDLKRIALEATYVVALFTFPAYLSGVGAQQALRDTPDVSAVSSTRTGPPRCGRSWSCSSPAPCPGSPCGSTAGAVCGQPRSSPSSSSCRCSRLAPPRARQPLAARSGTRKSSLPSRRPPKRRC